MIQDLQGRKASAFTSPEWQSAPWRKHKKGLDQLLYDIGAELATILADADRLKLTRSNRAFSTERMKLVEDCQKLEDKLEAWYDQLSQEIPSPHYWAEFSNMQNPIDDREGRKIFPIAFRYANIYIAKILIDYWALSILLSSTSLLAYQSLTAEMKPHGPEHPADDQHARAKAVVPRGHAIPAPRISQRPGSIKTMADSIAQSMEYCLLKDMGTLGPQWALFGLRVAMQTYRYSSRNVELRWSKAIHDRICDEKGVKLSRTVAAYEWETSSSSQGNETELECGLRRFTGCERAFRTQIQSWVPSPTYQGHPLHPQ